MTAGITAVQADISVPCLCSLRSQAPYSFPQIENHVEPYSYLPPSLSTDFPLAADIGMYQSPKVFNSSIYHPINGTQFLSACWLVKEVAGIQNQ